MAEFFPTSPEGRNWFAACDPAGSKLGSGGGVAHLLASAGASRSAVYRGGHDITVPAVRLADLRTDQMYAAMRGCKCLSNIRHPDVIGAVDRGHQRAQPAMRDLRRMRSIAIAHESRCRSKYFMPVHFNSGISITHRQQAGEIGRAHV